MNTLEAIKERRSIRIYKQEPIPDEVLKGIFEHTILAPSAHNNQPWQFIILQRESKEEFVKILEEKYRSLTAQGIRPGYLKQSIGCIKRAPVFALVLNTKEQFAGSLEKSSQIYEWMLNLQSLGGAIQTMLLAAQEYGIGSLWTCEILYADPEITAWLQTDYELIGGVCLGYADEDPKARPRMGLDEVLKWM